MPRNRLSLSAVALVAGLVLTVACSGISTHADYEPGTEFSGLRTYAWLEPHILKSSEDHPLLTPMLIDRIEAAVDRELAAKGIVQIDRDEADFLIRKQLSVASRLQLNDPYYSYDRVTEFEEGTLVVDFLDPVTNRVVWRGVGQAKILGLESPEARGERVDDVVARILRQFPPDDG